MTTVPVRAAGMPVPAGNMPATGMEMRTAGMPSAKEHHVGSAAVRGTLDNQVDVAVPWNAKISLPVRGTSTLPTGRRRSPCLACLGGNELYSSDRGIQLLFLITVVGLVVVLGCVSTFVSIIAGLIAKPRQQATV